MIVAIRENPAVHQQGAATVGSGCVWCGVISGLAAAVTGEGVLRLPLYSGLLLPAVLMAELACRGHHQAVLL
ncbi:Uncharacterised protein [Escherichia coli]|uniref:Uncharacterized protein n=1 Tax=Escherichia coli TaxID=562 RepID=A0A376VTR2_ECOLX|nr:Uncharacterised protein [Escherichia coli]